MLCNKVLRLCNTVPRQLLDKFVPLVKVIRHVVIASGYVSFHLFIVSNVSKQPCNISDAIIAFTYMKVVLSECTDHIEHTMELGVLFPL